MNRYVYVAVFRREASRYPWETVRLVHRLVEAMDADEAAREARRRLHDEDEMPSWNMFLDDFVVEVD